MYARGGNLRFTPRQPATASNSMCQRDLGYLCLQTSARQNKPQMNGATAVQDPRPFILESRYLKNVKPPGNHAGPDINAQQLGNKRVHIITTTHVSFRQIPMKCAIAAEISATSARSPLPIFMQRLRVFPVIIFA